MVAEATDPSVSKPLTLRERITRLRLYLNKYPALALGALLFIFLAIILSLNQQLKQGTLTGTQAPVSNVLRVVGMSPEGKTFAPKTISFTFSEPVDAEIVHHYFEISHELAGHLTQDAPNVVVYHPEPEFPTGATISIKINKGLVSTTGKPLLTDYFNSIQTGLGIGQIRFEKDYLGGRVLSYASTGPVTFTVDAHRDLKDITVSIYRSDETQLLRFLTYEDETVSTNYYDDYILSDLPRELVGEEVYTNKVETGKESAVNLTPGVYYAKAIDGNSQAVGSTFLLVSSKGLIFRQDDQKLTLSAFDYNTNRLVDTPLPVSFYSFADSPTRLGGIEVMENQQVAWNFGNRLDAVIGRTGGEVILVPVHLPLSQAEIKVNRDLSNSYQVFMYTDRPIYKPGDTVKFRGVVRVDNDSLYTLPPTGTAVRITSRDYYGNNQQSDEKVVVTNGQGVFSGEWQLDTSDTGGVTYLYARINRDNDPDLWPQYEAMAYFDVVSYVKPEYDLKMDVAQTEYLKNDELSFTVTGTYFDGRPLANTEVDYQLYTNPYYEAERAAYNTNFNIREFGGMCGAGGFGPFEEYFGSEIKNGTGKVTLDGSGKATIKHKLDEKTTSSQKIVAVAKKVDTSQNEIVGAANTIVHAAEHNIFFIPSKDRYQFGEELVVPFYAEKLTGEKLANTDFTYKLLTRNYQGNSVSGKEELVGSVTSDGNGRGIVKLVPPTGTSSIYLTVEKPDSRGNVVLNEKHITVSSPEELARRWDFESPVTQTYLKITADKNSFQTGDTIALSVVSPKTLDAYVTLERGRIYKPQRVSLQQGENQLTFPVDDLLSPSISVMFTFFANGAYHTEGVVLNVPAMHKLMNVEITTDKTRYTPSETAQITVSTKDPDGVPVQANLSLAVVDKAIFALRKNATPPAHSSFYYFRPRATNASSSLTAVGDDLSGGRGGGGGGLDASPTKQVDTLYWNPNVVTDVNGLFTALVPLQNITTTWKIQAIGATNNTLVGQDDAEFLAAP